MSQHASLKVDSVGIRHRNVLSRLERMKKIEGEGSWNEKQSIFGLPKVKSLKIKVKKSGGRGPKEAEEEGKEKEKAKK